MEQWKGQMEVLELKGINSRMKASSSSVSAAPKPQPRRRPPKESFCEFDIIENFTKQQQQRRRKKRTNVETTELSRRIREVAARNEKIDRIHSLESEAKVGAEEANKRSHRSRILTRPRSKASARAESPDPQPSVVLVSKICQNCSGQIDDKILSEMSAPTTSARKHDKRKAKKPWQKGELLEDVRTAQESLKHLITVYENLNNTGFPNRSKGRRDSGRRSEDRSRHRAESKGRHEEAARAAAEIAERTHERLPLSHEKKLRIERWKEGVDEARSRSASEHRSAEAKSHEDKVERPHRKRTKKHCAHHAARAEVGDEERRDGDCRSSERKDDEAADDGQSPIVDRTLKTCLSGKVLKEVKFCDRSVGNESAIDATPSAAADDKEVHLECESFDDKDMDLSDCRHRDFRVEVTDDPSGRREIKLLNEAAHAKLHRRVKIKEDGNRLMHFLGGLRTRIERSKSPKPRSKPPDVKQRCDAATCFEADDDGKGAIGVDEEAFTDWELKEESTDVANLGCDEDGAKLGRKELSFSNLNLSPVNLNYLQLPKHAEFAEVVEDIAPEPKVPKKPIESRPKLSRTALALKDIFKVNELEQIRSVCVSANFRSPRKNDRGGARSDVAPISYKPDAADLMNRNVFGRNKFHTTKNVLPTERIVEISSKIFRDQKVSFTVEGVEPPKRLQLAKANSRTLKSAQLLRKQLFVGIEVISGDLSGLCHGRKSTKTRDASVDSLEKAEGSAASEAEKPPKRSRRNSQVSLKCKRYRPQRKDSLRSQRSRKVVRRRSSERGKKVNLIDSETQTDLDVTLPANNSANEMPTADADSLTRTLSRRSIAVEVDLDRQPEVCATAEECTVECADCKVLMKMLKPDYTNHFVSLHRSSKSESNISAKISEPAEESKRSEAEAQPLKSKSVNNVQRSCYVSRIPKLQIPRYRNKPAKEVQMTDKITLNKQYTANEIIALETCLNSILEKLHSDADRVAPAALPESETKLSPVTGGNAMASPRKKAHSRINVIRPKKFTHRKSKRAKGKANSVSSASSSSVPTIKSVYKNGKEMASSVTTLSSNCSDSCYPKTKSSVSVQLATVYYDDSRMGAARVGRQAEAAKKKRPDVIKRKSIGKKRSRNRQQDFKKVVKRDSNRLRRVPSTCSPSKRPSSSTRNVAGPKDMGVISKEPFYMHDATRRRSAGKVSVDSLEQQRFASICPLTDIFHFSPPSYAYYVYNTEVQTIKPPPAAQKQRPNLTSFRETSTGNTAIIFNETRKVDTKSLHLYDGRFSLSPRLRDKRKIEESNAVGSFSNVERTCRNLIFNYSEKPAADAFAESLSNSKELSEATQNNSGSNATIQNPLVSNESGYESCRSHRTTSIKNFFKKSGGLLEMFKSATKTKRNNTDLKIIKETASTRSATSVESATAWFGRKRRTAPPKEVRDARHQTDASGCCRHKSTQKSTKCPCAETFEKQVTECQKYAEKVIMESKLRKEGYRKQYNDFKEMPLDILMGKRMCRGGAKCGCTGTPAAVQTSAEPEVVEAAKSESSMIAMKDAQGSVTVMFPEEKSDEVSTSIPTVENFEDAAESLSKSDEHSSLQIDLSNIGFTTPSVAIREESFAGPSAISSTEIKDSPTRTSDASKLSDKEMFDKLLHTYEKKDSIAKRLSEDQQFFEEQISIVQSVESREAMEEEAAQRQSQEQLSSSKGPRFSDKTQTQRNDCTVQADDIGTCFARGFRPDNLMLSGDACFNLNKQDKIKMSPHMLKNTESIIDFSERETPLDFLLALGFMVDEASNALKDDDIRSRLLAAITEARVWINKITTTQGTLLYLVAYKARPETMRYFLQLVEAIINKRINNAIKLDGFLRVLEQVEDGKIQMINILGEDKFEDEENEEKIVKKQLKHLFINVYSIAEKEATERKKELTREQINLLRILVAKYRAGLHPHLELIARYIGQGLLDTEVQLEAAMIFLSRLDTAEVKLKEFENYCGISCDVDDKLRHQPQ